MSMNTTVARVSAATLDALARDPDAVEDLVDNPSSPRVDVHKAWGGIHYLLTGTTWEGAPPDNFLLAGDEIGEDLGYGPARAHGPAATKQIAERLQALPAAALLARFDGPAMAAADVYSCSGHDDDREFLEHFYAPLRALVLEAAAADEGLVVWMV